MYPCVDSMLNIWKFSPCTLIFGDLMADRNKIIACSASIDILKTSLLL